MPRVATTTNISNAKRYGYDISSAQTLSGTTLGSGIVNP